MATIPLSGVTVTGFRKESDNTFTNVGSSTSDSPTGHYFIGNLTAGDYTLKFVDPNGFYLTSYYGGADNLQDAALISVPGGTFIGGKDYNMTFAGSIQGDVTGDEPL